MIRKVRINAYQVGLVFENKKLVDVLEEGSSWLFGNKELISNKASTFNLIRSIHTINSLFHQGHSK